MLTCSLIKPTLAHLPHYTHALERGWSPDNIRKDEAIREQLAQIADDPERFVAEQDDPDALGPPITLPDGSAVQRLPGIHRWLWDGEFCGVIGFRWQPGSSAVPAARAGAYRIFGRGVEARAGLRQSGAGVPPAGGAGAWLDLCRIDDRSGNIASKRVILFNRGRLVERFRKAAAYGGAEAFRFRIDL